MPKNLNTWIFSWLWLCFQSSLDVYSTFGFLFPVRDAGSCPKNLLFMDLSSTTAELLSALEPHFWGHSRIPIPGNHLSLRNIFPVWLSPREGAGTGSCALDFWTAGKCGSPIYPPAIPAGILAPAPPGSAPKPCRDNGASGMLNIFPWSTASWKYCQGMLNVKIVPGAAGFGVRF